MVQPYYAVVGLTTIFSHPYREFPNLEKIEYHMFSEFECLVIVF